MIAGRMRHWLNVYRPTVEKNQFGEERQDWEFVRRIHAERVIQRGCRSEEVQEHFPDHRVEYNIRSVHPIGENWRVREGCDCGNLYTVVSILENEARGYVTLVCERVNE